MKSQLLNDVLAEKEKDLVDDVMNSFTPEELLKDIELKCFYYNKSHNSEETASLNSTAAKKKLDYNREFSLYSHLPSTGGANTGKGLSLENPSYSYEINFFDCFSTNEKQQRQEKKIDHGFCPNLSTNNHQHYLLEFVN
jgi:hypothetical protein